MTTQIHNIFKIGKYIDSADMKLFHLDIRSVHKNSDQIVLLLAQIDGEFDVLILTGTFLVMILVYSIFHFL